MRHTVTTALYTISILENNTNMPLADLVPLIESKLPRFKNYNFSSGFDKLTEGVDYLKIDEMFRKTETWNVEKDLVRISKLYPDVCIQVAVSPIGRGNELYDSRFVFYNGKSVQQSPTMVISYPSFVAADFDQWIEDERVVGLWDE